MAVLDESHPVRAYLFLHFLVFIWGFTAILGKLVELPATVLVWHRMFIAVIAIALYMGFLGRSFKVDRKGFFQIAGTGLLVAFHWVCFFGSIKVSTASVALVCLSSNTLFTAAIEPFAYRRSVRTHEIVLGIVAIVAVWIIFQFEYRYVTGIVLGLLSAFASAVFNVINGRFVQKYNSTLVGLYEMGAGLLGVTAYLVITAPGMSEPFLPQSLNDILWLLILGVVCTSFAFIAGVEVMKVLTPYTVSLAVNLEPIYGIVLALAIFGESERMSGPFYAGAALILLTIFIQVWIDRRAAGAAVTGESAA